MVGVTDRVRKHLEKHDGEDVTPESAGRALRIEPKEAGTTLARLANQGDAVRVARGVYRNNAFPLVARQPGETTNSNGKPRQAPPKVQDPGWTIVHEWPDGDLILVEGDKAWIARLLR